jgi:hypothetical protein
MHASQMKTFGPARSLPTSLSGLPQNEQRSRRAGAAFMAISLDFLSSVP